MLNRNEIIRQIYSAFNARAIDTVFQFLHPDVHWPNGWEGGYIDGQDAVRQYWLRQWQQINPVVTPITIEETPAGQVIVDVHQVIQDGQGNLLADERIKHIYTFDGEKISQMDIEKR